jgi:hypothetical protein
MFSSQEEGQEEDMSQFKIRTKLWMNMSRKFKKEIYKKRNGSNSFNNSLERKKVLLILI